MQKFNAEKNGKLLDTFKTLANLKNDAAMARALDVAPPVISKIRHGRLGIGDTLLIAMHEQSELSIRGMKKMIGKKCLNDAVMEQAA